MKVKNSILKVITALLVVLTPLSVLLALKMLLSLPRFYSWESGIVVHVYDGDTLRIKFNHQEKKVRLLGVDSPEIGHPSEKEDLWARLARRYSLFHLLRKRVRLDYENQKEDRYGRLLAYVWVDKDIFFNEKIIKDGLARSLDLATLNPEIKKRFRQAEAEAKRLKKGIWQNQWPLSLRAEEADLYLGQVKAVELICRRIKVEKGYTLIYDRDSHFQVYISRDRRPLFSDLQKIKLGDKLVVFGLIETYQSYPQIILFYPQQLKLQPKN
ncbi:MAG: thermonuclease family protein [Candidatus Aminicenantes bacterium]|nr:thermonuclease family protein [Candidatus Aminicenantes bacterium]